MKNAHEARPQNPSPKPGVNHFWFTAQSNLLSGDNFGIFVEKDAFQSSVAYNGEPVYAVDGNSNTMIHTSDQLGDDDNPWLIIDFGDRNLVVSVDILNRPVWNEESGKTLHHSVSCPYYSTTLLVSSPMF